MHVRSAGGELRGQWLHLRELHNAQPLDREFDENLRDAFEQETQMLFADIVREDRSPYRTAGCGLHLGERAARAPLRHSRMCAVATCGASRLPKDSPRRGLLGQGSILTRHVAPAIAPRR